MLYQFYDKWQQPVANYNKLISQEGRSEGYERCITHKITQKQSIGGIL
jgi:hypothetical protein